VPTALDISYSQRHDNVAANNLDAEPVHPLQFFAVRSPGPLTRIGMQAFAVTPNDTMKASSNPENQVLIVGAGPTGLVLAVWLTRLGVRVRIVDKTAGPGTTSRALAVQARTLELYRQIGLADTVVESGRKAVAANLWVAGKRTARAALGDMGSGLSPYPYALIFPQDEHEDLLISRLVEAGVTVERRTELQDFEASADGNRCAPETA
jgi:2-polyprenyl-6-methoxyphenol hydroxylase-like FAD-dependent oxidoreductase